MSTTKIVTQNGRKKVFNAEVVRWAFWDWGSAAFNSVATTFVFTIYLTSDAFGSTEISNEYLSIGMTVAGIIIALVAPITGQRADRQGKSGVWLGWFTGLVALCLLGTCFVYPEGPLGREGELWLGIALLGLGNIFFEFASVSYNAMLNYISDKDTMGRVSGFGWAMGYIGGIVLLFLIVLINLIESKFGFLGATDGNGIITRASMLLATLWFVFSTLPLILKPPHPHHAPTEDPGKKESIADSYRLLWKTIKGLAKNSKSVFMFLISSAIYRDGLAGVFTFGAILGASVFGLEKTEIIFFAIAANVIAGVVTFAFGALDDFLGPRTVIITSLVLMIAAGMGVFFFHNGGKNVFWVCGLALSAFVGPVQSASRSLLARIVPEGRSGEAFGLYATTGRAVSFLAPLFYYLAIQFGKLVVPAGEDPTYWGIIGIMVIIIIGLVLLVPIKGDDRHIEMAEHDD